MENTTMTAAPGDSPVRFILAGASRRGIYMAKDFVSSGLGVCVGIVDTVIARAEWTVADSGYPDCPVFTDLAAALAQVDAEAVLVTSTDAHHAELAVPALDAGMYVFCEKPLETTTAKCRAIVEADARAGGRTFVGLNLRYAPVYATVRRLIEEGAVGDILTVQADDFYNGGRTYFRRWNRLISEGGGLWITKATHDFDLLNWLTGDARPLEVSAMAERSYYVPRADAPKQCRDCSLDCHDRAKGPDELMEIHERATGQPWDLCLYNADSETFDHGIATIRFERDIFATYTCSVVAGFSERRIRVSGTRGTIDGVLGGDTLTVRRRDPSSTEIVPVISGAGGHGGADGNVMKGFHAFVRHGAEPRCRPAEAAVSVCMGLAATQATAANRPIRVADLETAAGLTRR
jgi:predicted dehydrogenase